MQIILLFNFVTSTLFEKKKKKKKIFFYRKSIKFLKNNFRLSGTRPSPARLDRVSALLYRKGSLLLKQRVLFREQNGPVHSF